MSFGARHEPASRAVIFCFDVSWRVLYSVAGIGRYKPITDREEGVMKMAIKFERVQWPVGHGGFHTGRLKGGNADFRYFFDCGAKSKESKILIREKLEAIEFDFGVISHFDNDHYSELASVKKVKVLLLPYMTPTDMVLQALTDQYVNKLKPEQAFQGFNLLRELAEKGTRIIMLNGRIEEQSDAQPGPAEALRGGLSWNIPSASKAVDGKQEMQHETAIKVQQSGTELLYFKFFNHRMEEASHAFEMQLKTAVTEQKLIRVDKTPYTSIEDFLADVAAGVAGVVHTNGKAMQGIYQATLSGAKLKAGTITESNLSSLTMFSRWNGSSICMEVRALSSRHVLPSFWDGWMLTGDLELTPKTWPAFNDHYFCELSECAVFNVPHHASDNSLCDEAVAFLASQYFVMPVNAGDNKHPDDALTGRLERHGVESKQSVTTDWESMVAIESLLRIWRHTPAAPVTGRRS